MAFQIIHAFEKFINRFDTGSASDFKSKVRLCLQELRRLGIDGIVTNINTENGYLENVENWENFKKGLREAVSLGYRIWVYDEKGYPSGGAGGIVLRDNPELEAKGIKFHDGRYFITNIYEGSHAERNFHEKRRYINLLESEAVRKFAKSTYHMYKKMLPEDLFSNIEAIFTDEPSLMTVVIQDLDTTELYPGRVTPVNDEPDPSVPIAPAIPYSRELDDEYTGLYGAGIMDNAPEIFKYSEEVSEYKCRFWESVAKTYEKTYGKVLSKACDTIGTKLTGHILYEESPVINVAFHANPFRVLKHFQLPGIDQLSNVQENISVFAHKMVSSCAWLKGVEGIMTETSEFYELRMGPKRPTGHVKIIAALYRQYALGVREFSFYYNFSIRKDKYGEITGTIKNLCEYGKGLEFRPDCAVYCAYETVWAGFYPSDAEHIDLVEKQPGFVQDFEASVLSLCDELYDKNIQFVLMDESSIDDMVEKGISQVILPDCRVVSKRLLELADEGKIRLFGKSPEYTYHDGRIEKASVDTCKMDNITAGNPFFEYDKGLIFTSFENGAYFCFNPTDTPVGIKLDKNCTAYDPSSDETKNLDTGETISINADSAMMIKVR